MRSCLGPSLAVHQAGRRQVIGMRSCLGPSLAVHKAGRRQQVVGMCSCLGPSLAVCGRRQVVGMEFSIRSDYQSSSNHVGEA